MMEFSAEQKRIFSELCDSPVGKTAPLIVKATAGSGKTTTCAQAAVQLRIAKPGADIVYLAFGRKNIPDIQEKFGAYKDQIQASTLNSLGFRVCMRELPRRPRLEKNKVGSIARSLYQEIASSTTLRDLTRGVSMAKAHNMNEAASTEAFIDLLMQYGIFSTEFKNREMAQMVRAILRENNLDEVTMDFDDQIYFPVQKRLRVENKFDFIFVDEFQDLTVAQLSLAIMHLKPAGRIVAIGDPYQAIFNWRGASASIFGALESHFSREGKVEVGLSTSFRCPKLVCKLAALTDSPIKAHESNEEGVVRTSRELEIDKLGRGHMVLCRLNAPLVKTAVQLMHASVTFEYVGRDFGAGLKTLVKTGARNAPSKSEALNEVGKILDARIKTANFRNDDALVEKINDQRMCVEYISGMVEAEDPELFAVDFGMYCDLIFQDRANGVKLSTVHRAKGLEAERVHIIEPERMTGRHKDGTQSREEMNVIFVAVTRAIKELVIVDGQEGMSYADTNIEEAAWWLA